MSISILVTVSFLVLFLISSKLQHHISSFVITIICVLCWCCLLLFFILTSDAELVHEVSNNVAFWHVKTWTSLCSLLLSLETPNGVQSVALRSQNTQVTSKGSDQTVCMRRLIWGFAGRTYHIVGYNISCTGSSIIQINLHANSMNPDQTAPYGAVWSGSRLFA